MPYKDKEKQLAAVREWYYKNKDRALSNSKKFYNENKDNYKVVRKKWYKDNRDRILAEYEEKYDELAARRQKNLKTSILCTLKARAAKKNLDFNLEKSDIVFISHCPVFGFPLDYTQGVGHKRCGYSIDRIDNSKGYIKGNIQIISRLANSMKQDATEEELKMFAEWINRKNYKTTSAL